MRSIPSFTRILLLALVAWSLTGGVATIRAQDSNPSVADAARKAQEQEKIEKQQKVITNDDLDVKNVKPGQQGLNVQSPPKSQTEPPNPGDVAKVKEADTEAGSETAKPAADKPEDSPVVKKLKERLLLAEKELDLLHREFALDQDTYISNPDHEHDTAGKAKLDNEQQQITDKQTAVDALKAALAEAQKKAGEEVSMPPEPPTSNTPPQQ